MKSFSNFERLVLGCIDSYDSESRRIFHRFSRSTVAPIGRKKGASTFLLPKKKNIWWRTTIRGALAGRRSPRRSSSGQPSVNVRSTLGQPSVNLRSTFGQPWVNLGSTLGQRSVNVGYSHLSPIFSDFPGIANAIERSTLFV